MGQIDSEILLTNSVILARSVLHDVQVPVRRVGGIGPGSKYGREPAARTSSKRAKYANLGLICRLGHKEVVAVREIKARHVDGQARRMGAELARRGVIAVAALELTLRLPSGVRRSMTAPKWEIAHGDGRADAPRPLRSHRSPAPHRRNRRRLLREPRGVVRLLRLRLHLDLFRPSLLPGQRSDKPTLGDGWHFRGRVLHAPARRLAFWLDRRPARPSQLDGNFGAPNVRRLAHDRGAAHLRSHWCVGPDPTPGRAPSAGALGRRRVRYRSDLHE